MISDEFFVHEKTIIQCKVLAPENPIRAYCTRWWNIIGILEVEILGKTLQPNDQGFVIGCPKDIDPHWVPEITVFLSLEAAQEAVKKEAQIWYDYFKKRIEYMENILNHGANVKNF